MQEIGVHLGFTPGRQTYRGSLLDKLLRFPPGGGPQALYFRTRGKLTSLGNAISSYRYVYRSPRGLSKEDIQELESQTPLGVTQSSPPTKCKGTKWFLSTSRRYAVSQQHLLSKRKLLKFALQTCITTGKETPV